MKKTFYAAVLVCGFASPLCATAQSGAVQFSPIKQIRKGVDAWPRVLNPKNEAERRIDGYLTNLNAKLARSLKDCDSDYSRVMGNRPQPGPGDEGAKSWTQDVKVTMSGPGFLSLVATTGFYCGGAHPYGFTSAAIFDLRTGEPVNLREWFQPSVQVSFSDEDDEDPSLEKSISVPGLLAAYREATHHECDDNYSDDQPFLIWPDSESGKVIVQAVRLPGCCEACGIETGISPEQARKLGFSETLLRAISDAHEKRTRY